MITTLQRYKIVDNWKLKVDIFFIFSFLHFSIFTFFVIFAAETRKEERNMSIDTYKLTSMEEPTDEVLGQLMKEAAEEAREANAQATQRYFNELRQAAAAIR